MPRRLGDATWSELDGDAARLILPVPLGSTEQHGPHLPLSTDTDIAVAVCERLAAARPDVVVAPSIAYGSSGSTVQVAVVGNGHDVDLKVHNEGPAIAAEQLPMLFEPFRRGVPEDRSPGGLGLGLYIVKQIVQAHDGSIGVESSEQAGTTFTLHLPREPIAPAAAAPA